MPADFVAIKAAMAGFTLLPTPLPKLGSFQETPNLVLLGLSSCLNCGELPGLSLPSISAQRRQSMGSAMRILEISKVWHLKIQPALVQGKKMDVIKNLVNSAEIHPQHSVMSSLYILYSMHGLNLEVVKQSNICMMFVKSHALSNWTF